MQPLQRLVSMSRRLGGTELHHVKLMFYQQRKGRFDIHFTSVFSTEGDGGFMNIMQIFEVLVVVYTHTQLQLSTSLNTCLQLNLQPPLPHCQTPFAATNPCADILVRFLGRRPFSLHNGAKFLTSGEREHPLNLSPKATELLALAQLQERKEFPLGIGVHS